MSEALTSTYLDTVGELRRFLEPFADDCPLRGDVQLTFTLDLHRGSYLTATTDGEPRRIPHELSGYSDEPCEDDTAGMLNHKNCRVTKQPIPERNNA